MKSGYVFAHSLHSLMRRVVRVVRAESVNPLGAQTFDLQSQHEPNDLPSTS